MDRNAILIGVVNPQVLAQADAKALQSCDALELRYDLFPDQAQWPTLMARLRSHAPQAILLATIRLECDGGKWPDHAAVARISLWRSILQAPIAPDWIDIEWPLLDQSADLLSLAQKQCVRVLASKHDFKAVPSTQVLESAVALASSFGVDGFKIAAMSTTMGDCQPLYDLCRAHCQDFAWFSAFAMGATGMASRLYSLHSGANLSYGALGSAVAPGQIEVSVMRQYLQNASEIRSEADVQTWLRNEGLLS